MKKATSKPKILLYSKENKYYDTRYDKHILRTGFVFMALFFVILLWFSIVILTLLTLHEVFKKYIIWVVEDYLNKNLTSQPKRNRKS